MTGDVKSLQTIMQSPVSTAVWDADVLTDLFGVSSSYSILQPRIFLKIAPKIVSRYLLWLCCLRVEWQMNLSIFLGDFFFTDSHGCRIECEQERLDYLLCLVAMILQLVWYNLRNQHIFIVLWNQPLDYGFCALPKEKDLDFWWPLPSNE